VHDHSVSILSCGSSYHLVIRHCTVFDLLTLMFTHLFCSVCSFSGNSVVLYCGCLAYAVIIEDIVVVDFADGFTVMQPAML